jgi:hypothetical protein
MLRVLFLNRPILIQSGIIQKDLNNNKHTHVIMGGQIQQMKPGKKLPIKFTF